MYFVAVVSLHHEEISKPRPFFCCYRHGLRKVPTLMLNLMTQWGSILIYYEMPSWVKDLTTSLAEQPDDSDNDKALKVSNS